MLSGLSGTHWRLLSGEWDFQLDSLGLQTLGCCSRLQRNGDLGSDFTRALPQCSQGEAPDEHQDCCLQNASIEISKETDLIINQGGLGRGTNWLFAGALVLLPMTWLVFG